MHSPLPDSSALEAGIIEDERPTRISRVQDNVRNLLRASVFSSIRGSTVDAPANHHATTEDGVRSPMQSPLRHHVRIHPDALPSPSSQTTTSTLSTEADHVSGVLFPPTAYQQQVQEMAHQSTMFNTRAVAALVHPDMSDPSLALFLQQKTESRQQRAWKRSRNRKLRHASVTPRKSQWLLCVVAGLLLGAIVSTYLALATSSSNIPVSPTFHILFVLGILLATIVFAHTLVRTCLTRRSVPVSPGIYVISNGRPKRRHRRHHNQHYDDQSQQREIPALSDSSAEEFVPPTPFPVHVASDEVEEVRPDSREAQPTAGAERASTAHVWDKDIESLANPPPAYGRWRGSVRADPELLHWQAIPSPVDPDTPALPSPTYEEAMSTEHPAGQTTGPPSYMTRNSPARRRDVQGARPELARAQMVEPEMVEGRGIGIAE
ncbi:hypothetical protein LTR36_004764 [Oleoguttula mirabilis]|uniref:Transmembrane protein n=1 Tax=Oleoguttula mirabilis TaxID=1507867 RepID=A0AAV9JFM2_9PEZI|nr:hypothetical protein LTR36_004764 [Oleoguttula mirabilis]